MMYRVSRKEHPIPTKEFTNKKQAIAYANSIGCKGGIPSPMIERVSAGGDVIGRINLKGEPICMIQ